MARKKPAPRPKRRARDTGTIRHRPERAEPWEAAWQHADGSREYRSFSQRSEAAGWLDSLVAKRAAGQDTQAGGLAFEAFIQKWLAIKSAKVSPKTAHNYRYYAEIASGQLGAVRLDALTLEHMEALLAYLLRARFKNAADVFGVLGQAFKYARSPSLRWMTVNPIEGLEIPASRRRQNQTLTEAQRAALLAAAAAEHDAAVPLLPLWHLYSRLALRKGEGVALEWRDVDWERAALTIDESVTNIGPDNPRGETKGRSVRVVPLPADVLELLRAHRAAQQRRGVFPSIFVGADGQTVTPQHVQYRWSLLRRAAGCPKTTLHDLRHTALYLLALAGAPENVRMALAGHTSADMAGLYANHAGLEDVRRFVG